MIETKWLVAGGVGVATLIGYLIWSGTAHAAEDEATKKRLAADKKKFYDRGFAEGSSQGTADRGKKHDPIVTLNEAETSLPKESKAYQDAVQAEYEHGVNDGYDKNWVAPAPVVVVPMSVPATPKSGGLKSGETASDYGCRRGGSRGWTDGRNGEVCDPSGYLETDGSKQRQNESGDPVAYRSAYKSCYESRCAAGAAAKAVADALKHAGEGGFTESVGVPRKEPRTGALISIGGVRVLGLRAPYRAPIVRRPEVHTGGFWGSMFSSSETPEAPSGAMEVSESGPWAPAPPSPTMETFEGKCFSFGYTRGKADAVAGNARDRNSAISDGVDILISDPADRVYEYHGSNLATCVDRIAAGYEKGYADHRVAYPGEPLDLSVPGAPRIAYPGEPLEWSFR